MYGSILGNIIGTLYFIYFQLAGIFLMQYLLKKEGILTRFLIGSVTGSALLQWLPVLFSFVFQFTLLSHMLAMIVLLPVFILAVCSLGKSVNGIFHVPQRIFYHCGFFVFLLAAMGLWGYLLHTHTLLLDESKNMLAGQCTYGDMNMHLGFITSIANQKAFPPDYSLYPGAKLSYPFLSDSISSSIYLMGASLRYAYILPMLTAFAQIAGSIYLLGITLFSSRTKALLTDILYLLNGGFGFIYFIDWSRNREYTFSDIFNGFYTTPTNLIDHNIRWVNVIVDMFLPQRATLFGYAILFPSIWLLYKAVFQGKRNYFLLAGILVSSLPMIHTHSFLGMALISAAWLLNFLYRNTVATTKRFAGPALLLFVLIMCVIQYFTTKGYLLSDDLSLLCILGILSCILYGIYLMMQYIGKKNLKKLLQTWGIYLGCVLLLALPQLLFWTFGHVIGNSNMVRGHFNWGNLGDFYPWFYLKNLGLPLILALSGICTQRKKASHLLMPIFVIFFVAELVVFQPNVYDNNKLLYIAYLFLCLIAADYGVELYQKLKEIGGAGCMAAIFLFFSVISGVLTLRREAVSEYQLYSAPHVKLAEYIEEHTATDAVILTNRRHNNEVASLTGRNLVCGADTFLYFHGIDTTSRQEAVCEMYENPASNQHLFEEYNVSYIVVSSWERSSYAVDESALQELFELEVKIDDICLYKVK